MEPYVCVTCGVQFAPTPDPPDRCPICEDERQYVGWEGQAWTTLEALRAEHRNRVEELETGLTGIGTEPGFGIGQRALLVETDRGNLLWDCVTLIDEATIAAVEQRGGLRGIAISHPHYYSAMVEWSRAFDDVPVFLHAADRDWIMRPDPSLALWGGESLELWGDLRLVRCGGHFDGGTVLHWPAGAGGRGALLAGDILQVTMDRRHVSFMYSYPNLIPLGPRSVERIAAAVEPLSYDRVYGAWWGRRIQSDARRAVERSVDRYLEAIDPES